MLKPSSDHQDLIPQRVQELRAAGAGSTFTLPEGEVWLKALDGLWGGPLEGVRYNSLALACREAEIKEGLQPQEVLKKGVAPGTPTLFG